jgi:hypothetical protein
VTRTRVVHIRRASSLQSPAAQRLIQLFNKAIDEGRSFKLEIKSTGDMLIELGPRCSK